MKLKYKTFEPQFRYNDKNKIYNRLKMIGDRTAFKSDSME